MIKWNSFSTYKYKIAISKTTPQNKKQSKQLQMIQYR